MQNTNEAQNATYHRKLDHDDRPPLDGEAGEAARIADRSIENMLAGMFMNGGGLTEQSPKPAHAFDEKWSKAAARCLGLRL